MNGDTFAQQKDDLFFLLNVMRERVAALQQLAGAAPSQQEALPAGSFEEIHTALRELRLATDELVAAHRTGEMERRRYIRSLSTERPNRPGCTKPRIV